MLSHSEYATMMFYWFYEPHFEKADEILQTFEQSGWARVPRRVLPMACTVLALEEYFRRHNEPERGKIWRQNHPDLYKLVDLAIGTPKEVLYWADGLIAMWIILRDDRYLQELLERAGPDGKRDLYTADAINQMAQYHSPFRKAMERMKAPEFVLVN